MGPSPPWIEMSMRLRNRWTPLIVALSVTGAQLWACAADSQTHPASEIRRLAPLRSVVKSSGVSVWVEYRATCAASGSEHMPLDLTIHDDNKQGQADALSAVRDLMKGDKGVSVSQIRPGLIGVRSDDVWSSIFQAKLVDLKLEESDRYNPESAINAGIRASDASLRALRAEPAIRFGGLEALPSKGRPHLKASAKYATLGDLLDDVTRTFGGIVVYRECARSNGGHLFDIDFYGKDDDYGD